MKAGATTFGFVLVALLAAPAAHAAPTTVPAAAPDMQQAQSQVPFPAAGGASAQQSPWSAWLGCWRAVVEGAALQGLVCVVPGEDAQSVRVLTLEDGEIAEETRVYSDGVARRVEEGGCVGTEQAQWSSDSRRVLLRTELDCDGVRRVSTGVLAFVGEAEWVDVQALSVGESHATRTIRYRAARTADVPEPVAARLPAGRELATEAARLRAAAPLELGAVVELSRRVSEPALEALLAAAGHGFALDARTLVQLEQQGVAPSTLDVMIALSYPERFAVRARELEERTAGAWPTYGGSALVYQCMDPFYAGLGFRGDCARYFGLRSYSRHGALYHGYSPWGYDPYGWRYGRTPVVIIRPGGDAGEGGTAVKGRGYTRGSSPATGNARPRSGGQGGGEARGRDGGTSQPAASPATGTSTGSSRSGDTGRTAKPRDGGGDE